MILNEVPDQPVQPVKQFFMLQLDQCSLHERAVDQFEFAVRVRYIEPLDKRNRA
jgi:hypothetical protein